MDQQKFISWDEDKQYSLVSGGLIYSLMKKKMQTSAGDKFETFSPMDVSIDCLAVCVISSLNEFANKSNPLGPNIAPIIKYPNIGVIFNDLHIGDTITDANNESIVFPTSCHGGMKCPSLIHLKPISSRQMPVTWRSPFSVMGR